jgi:cysteinyl-tRNA synthetase
LDDIFESVDDNYYYDQLKKVKIKFFEVMDNDFNTPDALATIFNYIRELNRALDGKKISKQVSKSILNFFGDIETIFGFDFKSGTSKDVRTNELLDVIVEVREELRKRKDWELADLIRSKLKDLNIILEDK